MKAKLSILLLFLLINVAVYVVTQINENVKIDLVLKENLKTLETHYKILLQTQKAIALTLYKRTIVNDRVLEIMAEAVSASQDKKELLRDELRDLLEFNYSLAKVEGILQYHFVFPNNKSFLRMHKPEKYGDGLTDVRDDLKYVNKTQKAIRSFTQGRISHGFRNAFPVFSKAGKYLGVLEASFSSDSLQWYLNHVSNIHTHFIVSKDLFSANKWNREDMIVKYSQSAESEEYLMTHLGSDTKRECKGNNFTKLPNMKQRIKKGLSSGHAFSLYGEGSTCMEVVSFLPIKNMKNRSVAWIVSFEKSPFIKVTLESVIFVRIIGFLVSLVLIYFLLAQIKSKRIIYELLQKTKEKAYTDGLTKVFNRNKFDEVLEEELQRVHRYSNQLSIALIDIDKFKEFNDTHGHLVGDDVLVMLAHCVDSNLRATDTFARWGGEEFVILFKETCIDTAKTISLKLKDKIEALEHPDAGKVTASFGLTQYIKGDTEKSIFKRCDEALYKAKEAGRNRVEIL